MKPPSIISTQPQKTEIALRTRGTHISQEMGKHNSTQSLPNSNRSKSPACVRLSWNQLPVIRASPAPHHCTTPTSTSKHGLRLRSEWPRWRRQGPGPRRLEVLTLVATERSRRQAKRRTTTGGRAVGVVSRVTSWVWCQSNANASFVTPPSRAAHTNPPERGAG